MNLIEHYIATATFKLPEKERHETSKELREFINSSIASMDNNLTEDEKIKKVLNALGDPDHFLAKYYRKKRSLIGPKYFYKYISVLKLVLLAIFIAITIGLLINHTFELRTTLTAFILEYIVNLFSGLSQGFVIVTLLFALLEYKGIEVTFKSSDGENINIPRIGPKKNLIKLSSCYSEIVLSILFFTIIYFTPEYIGAYTNSSMGITTIPLFNLATLHTLSSIIILIFIVQLLQNLVKIWAKQWTLLPGLIYSLLTVISSGLSITFILTPDLFNNKFFMFMGDLINIPNLLYSHIPLINIIIGIIILSSIIDITETLYKCLKYGI